MTIDERIASELRRLTPQVDEHVAWDQIQKAAATRRRLRATMLVTVPVAALGLFLVGLLLIGNDLPTAAEVQGDVPVEQMATIRQLVDAINARDAEAFGDAFTTEGYFNPRGDFYESSSLFGQHQPVSQIYLVQAWMAIIHAWGLEADLLACNILTEGDEIDSLEIDSQRGNWGRWPRNGPNTSLVRCDVASRWHSLSLEFTEGWVYEFSGTQLENWGFVLLDLNPDERTLPLGYDGLEAWEAWLESNDPLSADRYLNPRVRPSEGQCYDDSCAAFETALAPNDPELAARLGRLLWPAQKRWSIDGHEFSPGGLIPYDPAMADEIEASIREYLETK